MSATRTIEANATVLNYGWLDPAFHGRRAQEFEHQLLLLVDELGATRQSASDSGS